MNIERFAYWAQHMLDERDIAVLKIVKAGIAPRVFRFEVAFLISLGCITHNEKTGALKVTAKGEDALRLFLEQNHGHEEAS